MSRIVLASTSPFRKALLERLQLDFDTASPDIDETSEYNETATQLVTRLATLKAADVAKNLLNAIVIGSDQVAVCEDEILGKPGDRKNAIQQLKLISGKRVTFHTGLCVLNTQTEELQCDEVKFFVEFRELEDEMINHYLEKEPAFNCAGSFKSEGLGITLTSRMVGEDPTALVGLPLIRLTRMLERTGIRII